MGKKSKKKFNRKILKRTNKDRKVVEDCVICGKKLSKNSPHHNKCHSCWVQIGKYMKKERQVL